MSSYRRHYTKSHSQNPNSATFQPVLPENQPPQYGTDINGVPDVNLVEQTIAPMLEPLPHPGVDNCWSHDTNIPVSQSTIPNNTPAQTPENIRRTPLELRFPWFDPSKYNKIVDADGLVQYVHRTAGRPIGKTKTAWEKMLEDRLKACPNSPWYPFASEAEWKLAYWLATCKSSQSKIDEFLDMDGILAEVPTFGRAYNLFRKIEDELEGFGGPAWHCQQILAENFPEAAYEDIVLYLRNLEECLDYLVGRPDLDGNIWFAPEVRLAGDDEIQVFDEMPTGHLWHEILQAVHEAGYSSDAALGGVIFGSDKTHLTHYAGDVKVHALYVSLGNIVKDIRAQTSKRAWMLLAYIPICKWENTLERLAPKTKTEKANLPGILSRRLFHLCMEIICEPLKKINVHEVIDTQGNIRLIFYILLAYLADLEEQYMIAALDKSNCIHCTATTNKFGSPDTHPIRTQQSILDAIKRVQEQRHPNANPYQFSLGATKEGLGDVEYPFWASLPGVDICQTLSVDLLHSYYKYFFDHIFKWNKNSLGESEMDARIKAQVPYSGGRTFPKGVCHISQMSCKEHRALLKVHLSVLANSDIPYSRELTLATQALVDYIYYAQLPTHTELTLEAYDKAYQDFHKYKQVWIKNGSRRGKDGVIEHFNILKLHAGHHMSDQIRAKGAADNFSTETIEHLHIDTIKEAYPATNKKDWEKQTIRWLVRSEKLTELRQFHTWRKTMLKADTTVEPATIDCAIMRSHDEASQRITAIPPDMEPAQRSKRGGFAPASRVEKSLEVPQSIANAAVVMTKKRKRQIDDLDDKEERISKRVGRVQQLYNLSKYQDVTLRPTEIMTIAAAQEKYELPTLLDDCKASSIVLNSISKETVVGVWTSIRLTEPRCRIFPKVEWTRANATPPSDKVPAVADPVLYLRDRGQVSRREDIRLEDCEAGRLRLIFSLIPYPETQPPVDAQSPAPLFAYLHNFKSIATSTLENATNMIVIKKPARLRPHLVDISQIVRICPLAPRFSGPAILGVTHRSTLDAYDSFYLNKYRSISDFIFLNGLQLKPKPQRKNLYPER
ncbi:beige protein [Ceratobasidium sp. AG-Ba]|nr:beige protein [Ceratobasidium sp. AG-Ba]